MAKRILLVDDDRDFLYQMRLQLEALGFEIVTAEGMREAREVFARQRPDLAIVDLMLDRLDDGFVLCRQLKQADARLPVILVTAVRRETGIGFDAATDEERSWVKADVMLDKPVRFETIRREVDRLLAASA